MGRKPKGPNTTKDRERITALEGQLKAQVAESRRLRRQIDELRDRDPLEHLRCALRNQSARDRSGSLPRANPTDLSYNPDDTVN